MLNDYKKKYGNGLNRRDFFKYSSVGLGSIYFTGCKHSNSEKIADYPIESSVYTTLEETVKLSDTILPVIIPKNLQDISKYDVSGYGVWENGGPLLAVLRRDIMPSAYTLPAENRPKKLLRFFAITDIHITDKESPSQLIYLQSANVAGDYLGIELESKMTSVYSPTLYYLLKFLSMSSISLLYSNTLCLPPLLIVRAVLVNNVFL